MRKTLLIADLHLTDSPKDEYRWHIFSWLRNQIKEHCIKRLIILGDLTDKKDKHSSKLVNLLIKNLNILSGICEEIIILKGNHDYVDSDCPFFEFLDVMPNIMFITEPKVVHVENTNYSDLFLPHTRNPMNDWGENFKELWKLHNGEYVDADITYRYIFMHQTVSGSIFANGFKIDTHKSNEYNECLSTADAKIYSGDVHVPQEVGLVTYVGSPYSINYGDQWIGGALLLDEDKEEILEYDGIIKWRIDIESIKQLEKFIKDNEVQEGDRAKVLIHLGREDFHLYNELRDSTKKILTDLGVDSKIEMKHIKVRAGKKVMIDSKNVNMNSKSILKQFGKREKLDEESINTGMGLLK